MSQRKSQHMLILDARVPIDDILLGEGDLRMKLYNGYSFGLQPSYS